MRLTVHLDHPPRTGPNWDPGGLQIARGLRRPLAGALDPWCDWVPDGPGGALVVRPEHREAIDAVDVSDAIRRGTSAVPRWSEVAGAPEIVDRAVVRFPGPLEPRLVPILSSPAWDLPGPERALDGVAFRTVTDPREALRALDRGELDLTCPTAFDLASALRPDPRFRPVELDLHLVIVVFAEELADPAHQRWLVDATHRVLGDDPVLRPVPGGEGVPPRIDRALRLAFGAYWPNGDWAEAVGAALASIGAPTALDPRSFDAMRDAHDVDLALALCIGEAADPDASWRWWVAERAGDPELLLAVLRGDDAEIEAALPVARLGTVRSGYVAPPEVPDLPLWRTAYPIAALLGAA